MTGIHLANLANQIEISLFDWKNAPKRMNTVKIMPLLAGLFHPASRKNMALSLLYSTSCRTAFTLHTTHMFGSIRQQCHMPRLLQRHAKAALMFRAGSRLAAGFDFATIRDVAFHETAGILVIDLAHMIVTKLAYFTARSALASPGRRSRRGAASDRLCTNKSPLWIP